MLIGLMGFWVQGVGSYVCVCVRIKVWSFGVSSLRFWVLKLSAQAL